MCGFCTKDTDSQVLDPVFLYALYWTWLLWLKSSELCQFLESIVSSFVQIYTQNPSVFDNVKYVDLLLILFCRLACWGNRRDWVCNTSWRQWGKDHNDKVCQAIIDSVSSLSADKKWQTERRCGSFLCQQVGTTLLSSSFMISGSMLVKDPGFCYTAQIACWISLLKRKCYSSKYVLYWTIGLVNKKRFMFCVSAFKSSKTLFLNREWDCFQKPTLSSMDHAL